MPPLRETIRLPVWLRSAGALAAHSPRTVIATMIARTLMRGAVSVRFGLATGTMVRPCFQESNPSTPLSLSPGWTLGRRFGKPSVCRRPFCRGWAASAETQTTRRGREAASGLCLRQMGPCRTGNGRDGPGPIDRCELAKNRASHFRAYKNRVRPVCQARTAQSASTYAETGDVHVPGADRNARLVETDVGEQSEIDEVRGDLVEGVDAARMEISADDAGDAGEQRLVARRCQAPAGRHAVPELRREVVDQIAVIASALRIGDAGVEQGARRGGIGDREGESRADAAGEPVRPGPPSAQLLATATCSCSRLRENSSRSSLAARCSLRVVDSGADPSPPPW